MLRNNVMPVVVWILLIACNLVGVCDLHWWIVMAPGWLVVAIPLACLVFLYALAIALAILMMPMRKRTP